MARVMIEVSSADEPRPDHHMIRRSQRIDPISRRLVADSHGPQSACDGGTIDAIPVPEPLKAFVRQLRRFMIAFGEPMWSFTSPLVGRTGGPEKFHWSTAKDFFNSIGT
jgi:hypothetical protein